MWLRLRLCTCSVSRNTHLILSPVMKMKTHIYLQSQQSTSRKSLGKRVKLMEIQSDFDFFWLAFNAKLRLRCILTLSPQPLRLKYCNSTLWSLFVLAELHRLCFSSVRIMSWHLLLICCLVGLFSVSQTIFCGQDSFGYICDKTSASSSFDVDLTTSPSAIWLPLGDDILSYWFPIGFSFPFYGLTYDSFAVHPNGLLVFGPCCNGCLSEDSSHDFHCEVPSMLPNSTPGSFCISSSYLCQITSHFL